jgi:hypothetical protein
MRFLAAPADHLSGLKVHVAIDDGLVDRSHMQLGKPPF